MGRPNIFLAALADACCGFGPGAADGEPLVHLAAGLRLGTPAVGLRWLSRNTVDRLLGADGLAVVSSASYRYGETTLAARFPRVCLHQPPTRPVAFRVRSSMPRTSGASTKR